MRFLLCLWLCLPAFGEFTGVIHTIAQSTNSNNVSTGGDPKNTSGKPCVFVLVGQDNVTTLPTPTDSKGNTYTGFTSRFNQLQWFKCNAPCIVGTNHTWSATNTGARPSIGVLAAAGCETIQPDQQTGANASINPGAVVPTEDGELVLGAVKFTSIATPPIALATAGYTTDESLDNTTNGVGLAFGHIIQTMATSTDPTWNQGGGGFIVSATSLFTSDVVLAPKHRSINK